MLSLTSLRTVLRSVTSSTRVCQKYYSVETLKPTFDNITVEEKSANDKSFATLLRNSTFIQMGNPVGKVGFTL